MKNRFRKIYVILAFLLAGMLLSLTGFADQEETAAAEAPADLEEETTGEDETDPVVSYVTVVYSIDNGEVYPGSEEVSEGEHPAGAIAAPENGRRLTGWTTDQDLTEEDGADRPYEAGEAIELAAIRQLRPGRDLSFTMHTAQKTAGEPTDKTPKIAFFGDSITRGRNGSPKGPTPVSRPFPWMIGKLMDAETYNFGVGYMGWIGLISETAYMKISSEDLSSYDAIVICMGTNDSLANAGKDTWSSTDPKTAMGQFNLTMEYLQKQDIKARVIIVAPWQTRASDRSVLSGQMKKASAFYGLSFISQSDCPIERTWECLPDGVHPDQEHYDWIAEWMAGKLKELGVAKYKAQIAWVEVEEPEVTYNGKEQTRKLKVYATNRGKIVRSASTGNYVTLSTSKYTVSYKNNVKAGTATVTVTGKEGSNPFYSGKATATFTIKPAKITEATVKRETMVYTGKAVTQSQLTEVKWGETVLKYGRGYTISYKNNVEVGKATMVITGKGNFTGTIKKTFKIVPASTAITELTSSARGKMVVKWEKQRTQTTGYEIQYSTTKDFTSGVKKVKTTKNTVVAQTISKLKAGAVYYVRIRTYKTVNGTNYYSAWSKVKSVTVFKK